jgi:hypothetical protein
MGTVTIHCRMSGEAIVSSAPPLEGSLRAMLETRLDPNTGRIISGAEDDPAPEGAGADELATDPLDEEEELEEEIDLEDDE